MLVQEQLILRTREVCQEDQSVVAAMMYGSFAKGSGDRYSDIEFVLFFQDEDLKTINHREWLSRIAPVALCFVNEFGITTVIFDNLIRGEFHFDPISKVAEVSTWGSTDNFPDLESAMVVDRRGLLRPHLSKLIGEPQLPGREEVQFIVDSFFNWFIFGCNVLQRGEYARALDLLWWLQRSLLKLARLNEGKIMNLPTPSRLLEQEIARESYQRFLDCTSGADPGQLTRAYRNCWGWGLKLMGDLKGEYGLEMPEALIIGVESVLREY